MNVVSTLVAIVGVDRFGRRNLFIYSGIMMIMCEIIVGVCLGHFFHVDHGVLTPKVSDGILAVICIYVANFAWSWGVSYLLLLLRSLLHLIEAFQAICTSSYSLGSSHNPQNLSKTGSRTNPSFVPVTRAALCYTPNVRRSHVALHVALLLVAFLLSFLP